MEIKESKAYKYAQWCMSESNKKVPRYVKKQAKDWLNKADGLDQEAYVDEKGLNKINKILKLMVHPDLMCPMNEGLEDYAWLLIIETLFTKLKNDENKDIRYYITALLEISRKNFKTFNSAVIFILLLLTDKPFSRFFSVDPELKLSSELKIAIRKIIKVSPLLAEEDVFKVIRSEKSSILDEKAF